MQHSSKTRILLILLRPVSEPPLDKNVPERGGTRLLLDVSVNKFDIFFFLIYRRRRRPSLLAKLLERGGSDEVREGAGEAGVS